MNIKIKDIRVDSKMQSRVEINDFVVAEYRMDMMTGHKFPPVIVFFDGTDYWLADGYHRLYAARQAGDTRINADVQQGTYRDAVLYSASANISHGLRRTNADKRRAVMTLLNDEEWSKWSDREIARKCGVDHTFVGRLRSELTGDEHQSDIRKGADGRTINTANIGSNGHSFDESDNAPAVYPVTVLNAGDVPQYESDPSSDIVGRRPMTRAAYITLSAWNEMGENERKLLLTPSLSGATFNSQKNDNIEWARWSWNPVTGCKHDCPYCYARDIAMRFYDQKFEPSFLPDRLTAPQNTVVPSVASNDIGYRNVFTCSMADLFGRWVPTEWIEAVLDAVRAAPQWNFLFLTKFPIRLSEFEFPDNAWVGTTVDCQVRVKNAEKAFRNVKAAVKWLSCEPMLEPLHFTDLSMFQWIVIGGASSSTQTPEWHPPREWVIDLEKQAATTSCEIYEKTNLLDRMRNYPGYHAAPASLPESMRYLPAVEK